MDEEMLDLDLGHDLDLDAPFDAIEQKLPAARAKKVNVQHHARRFTSEMAVEKTLPWNFAPGDCWHIISGGDIDALTYLRLIARQQIIRYCALSTWCMVRADVDEFDHLLTTGRLQRIYFYVGEIFKGSYSDVWIQLMDFTSRHGGRVAIFRNHSKVMAGFGEKFDFAIESSANLNTNYRSENTIVTIDTGLARFYKDWFDDIKSFNRSFDAWEPFAV